LNEQQAIRKSCLDRNAVLRRFAMGQDNDSKDCFVDIDGVLSLGCLLEQGTDTTRTAIGLRFQLFSPSPAKKGSAMRTAIPTAGRISRN